MENEFSYGKWLDDHRSWIRECLNHFRSYAQKIASIDLSVLIQMFSAIGRIVFLKSNIETNVFLDKWLNIEFNSFYRSWVC